jgi:integrase
LTIRSLPEGLHFDSKLSSFGIRVGKRRKTWIVIKGKNRTKVSLGHYPSISLQEARRAAHLALGTPHQPKAVPTVPEALEAFLTQERWKASSKYVLEKNLRRYCRWTRPLDKITHEDVAQVIDAIPTLGAKRSVLKDIKTFFSWCVPRYIPQSPCTGLKAIRYVPRERVLTKDELKRVWNAADEYPFGTIIRLLILTGQRRAQITALQWQWIKDDTIQFPGSIMKNGMSHTIPLGSLADKIIGTISKTESPYLFPSRRGEGNHFSGWGKLKYRLDTKANVSDWTIHDLRRVFSSGLASLNVPIHVTEKLLAHTSGTISGVAAIYNKHAYFDEQTAALQAWEDWLSSLRS